MRTDANLTALKEALLVNCGDLFDACRRVRLSPMFVKQWMKDDADVRAELTEAERCGALALQSEAIRRATQGVEKGVYFKGERIDTEVVYSDGLLTKLLAGRMPDVFGKEAEGGGSITAHGNVQINIMPRASNYDEWLRMKDSTLIRRDALDAAAKALPAPMKDVTPETEREASLEALANIMCRPPSTPFEGIDL